MYMYLIVFFFFKLIRDTYFYLQRLRFEILFNYKSLIIVTRYFTQRILAQISVRVYNNFSTDTVLILRYFSRHLVGTQLELVISPLCKLCFCIEDPILEQQLEKPVLDGSLAVKLLVSSGFLSSHVPTVHTVLTFVHSLSIMASSISSKAWKQTRNRNCFACFQSEKYQECSINCRFLPPNSLHTMKHFNYIIIIPFQRLIIQILAQAQSNNPINLPPPPQPPKHVTTTFQKFNQPRFSHVQSTPESSCWLVMQW